MGTVKRFCTRGHDTDICGRTPSSWCRDCKRINDKRPRVRKKVCRNGHDTALCGRSPAGVCRECRKATEWRKRHLGVAGGLPAVRLRKLAGQPIVATLAWMAYRGVDQDAGGRQAARLFSYSDLSIDQADRWCIALGTHLSIVYPEVYALADLSSLMCEEESA